HPDPPLPGALAQDAPSTSDPVQSLENLIHEGIVKHFKDIDVSAATEYFRNGRFQSDREMVMDFINNETQKAMDTLQNEYGGLEGLGRRVADALSGALRAFAHPPSQEGAAGATTTADKDKMDVDAPPMQSTAPPGSDTLGR